MRHSARSRGDARALLGLVEARVGLDHVDLLLDVAAEDDVGAPAGHVGRDRDHLRPAGLGDDLRLVGVLLGVQHLVRELRLLQHRGELLRVLDRGRTHQHRLPALVAALDVGEHRLVLLELGLVDLVEPVLADHRHVGRDHHHLEVVDLLELVGLGVGGAGHAGELLEQAEVVLERDRGERLVLALDLDPLLRLERLVHAVRPAAAGHQPAGELVDDDHLVVLDDVVAVAEEEVVRAQRLMEVVVEVDVRRLVQARPLGQHPRAREQHLRALVPRLGQEHGVVLLVDVEVAGRIGGRLALQHRRDRVHLEVDVGAVVGLARNDERRARLVDQDRVDLVDDRVVQPALEALLDPHRHVVAQVVEAELVVGAVGDVGGVGGVLLLVRHLRQDRADGQADGLVNLAHPRGVAAREVVVDGDDVDALAGQGVEVGGQRRDQGLALAGAHLGDLAVVEHHPADELDVEVAHVERPLRRLADDGERFREQVVERLAAREAILELRGLGRERLVRERRDLRLERVDARDGLGIAS